MLRNAVGGGSVSNFPEKDVTNVFNIISVTRGRVDVNFPEKKHFVTSLLSLLCVVSLCFVPKSHLFLSHRCQNWKNWRRQKLQ